MMHHNPCMLVSLELHRPFIVPVYTTKADPPPHSAPRGNLSNFIGEDPLPAPLASDQPSRRAPNPRLSPSDTTSGLGSSSPDPSAWSNGQQQQFLQALLGGPPPRESRAFDVNAPLTNNAAPDDPLLALLSGLGIEGGMGRGREALSQPRTEPKPKTLIQKLLPLLHVISVWVLVAFFIFWREPEAFRERNSVAIPSGNIWSRWARLASATAKQSTWGIEIVVSLRWSRLQSISSIDDMHRSHFSGHLFPWSLRSTRHVSSLTLWVPSALHNSLLKEVLQDSTQPPLLLTLALPYLPKPLPSIIMYGLRYLQLLGTLVDDLATAVVAMGLFIAVSNSYENWSFP